MSVLSERRKRRTHPPWFRRIVSVNILRVLAFLVLLWGEYLVFWSSSQCQWPDEPLRLSHNAPRTHILLLSDPQVSFPLPFLQSWSIIDRLHRAIFSSNLRKSWHSVQNLKPDVIIFLGDMLASGKYATDEPEFTPYWNEFQRIFPTKSEQVYYLPGNNDVGMGTDQYATGHVRSLFQMNFGPFNQLIDIQNHTFVLLDAPGLVDEDYQRSSTHMDFQQWAPQSHASVQFVKSLSTPQPVVLLSHIPLYRPDRSFCGPYREKGTIRKGVGHGYQNTLGKETTKFLLESLEPAYMFSGDNRDYCEYTHSWYTDPSEPVSRAREVTVKSFSMAKNIRSPGFQLLTVTPPPLSSSHRVPTLADRPCLLPDQYGIYTSSYFPYIVLNLLILFALNTVRTRYLESSPGIAPIATSRRSTDLAFPQTSPRGTPLLHPTNSDAVWSPYNIPVPISPRSTLPAKLRTPNKASVGPNLRAASRPTTPTGTPLLQPIHYLAEEDEDDRLYVGQYATQRHVHSYDDDWTPGNEATLFPPQSRDILPGPLSPSPSPYFLPAPSLKPKPSWTWSWTFVMGGRRRRITIRAPEFSLYSMLNGMPALFKASDTDSEFLRRGIFFSSWRDWFAIYIPILFIWLVMLWRDS